MGPTYISKVSTIFGVNLISEVIKHQKAATFIAGQWHFEIRCLSCVIKLLLKEF